MNEERPAPRGLAKSVHQLRANFGLRKICVGSANGCGAGYAEGSYSSFFQFHENQNPCFARTDGS